MPIELARTRNVQAFYGVRTTDSKFGGNVNSEVIKVYSMEFSAPVSSAANTSGEQGMSNVAWAKNGLDFVLPGGSIIMSADVVVEAVFNTLDALNIGTYSFHPTTGAVTAISVAGLIAAAQSNLTTIDAIGDRLACLGVQVNATGTGSAIVIPAGGAVFRVLYTGTVPTLGKAKLTVRYLTATA